MEHGIENVLELRTDFPLNGLDRLYGEMAHRFGGRQERRCQCERDKQSTYSGPKHAQPRLLPVEQVIE